MRGIDYRTTSILHLLLATEFANERIYQQALGRVGRNGDRYTRSRITSATVSLDQHLKHVGNIHTAINACKGKAKEEARQRKEAKAQAGKDSRIQTTTVDAQEESKEEAKETRMLE